MTAYFEWPLSGDFRDVGPTPLRRWDACSACGGQVHVQIRELELALQPELSAPPRVGTTMDGEVVVHDEVASDLADLGCAFESRPVRGVGEGRLRQLVPKLVVSEAANRALQRHEPRFSGRRVAGPSTPWPEPIDWGSMN